MKSATVASRHEGREAAILATNQTSLKQTPLALVSGVRRIPVGGGKFALVDAEDYEFLSQFKWHIHRGYAAHGVRIGRKVHTVLMHRVVMLAPTEAEIDHKNGDRLDNRKSVNLRFASRAGNSRNRGLSAKNSSGFKGVHFNKRRQKWEASIRTDRGRKHLGYFDTAEEGALAYNKAAIKHHGEFACLNNVGVENQ